VPIALTLSTPLTWTMMRAAAGPLADSITHYLTAVNISALAIVAAAGAMLPWLFARRDAFRSQPASAAIAATLAFAIVVATAGPLSTSHIDTRGLHRNALGALFTGGLPRVRTAGGAVDWRASPFGGEAVEHPGRLRGTAAGRNVLLIVLESTAARYLGLYGADRDPMPGLTRLAAQSLVFERAYAVYPESVKGLFALLCSRYPAFDTAPESYARVPCAGIGQRLKDAGYRTALFHSGRFAYLGMRAMIDGRGFDVLEDAGTIGGNVESSFGVDERSTVRRMLAWIDALDRGQRFFVTYLPVAGHHPYITTAPGPFAGSGDFTQYLNALHESDQSVGDLVQGLIDRRLDDQTLIVVIGDHGEAFGQHAGNFAHTLFIYDENVRVPFVVAAPGLFAGPVRVTSVASVIDTAPTILDLLGLPLPDARQGSSLLDGDARMALFFTDYALGWLGLVDGCWKYLYEIDARRSRLFDVCRDPDEATDRAADFRERVDAYRLRLEEWAAAQREAIGRGQ
jgi:lipoteichoic acid synthase